MIAQPSCQSSLARSDQGTRSQELQHELHQSKLVKPDCTTVNQSSVIVSHATLTSLYMTLHLHFHTSTFSLYLQLTYLTCQLLNLTKSPRQLVDDGQYHGRKRRSIRRRLIGRTDMLQPNITREYDGLVNLQSGSPSPTI